MFSERPKMQLSLCHKASPSSARTASVTTPHTEHFGSVPSLKKVFATQFSESPPSPATAILLIPIATSRLRRSFPVTRFPVHPAYTMPFQSRARSLPPSSQPACDAGSCFFLRYATASLTSPLCGLQRSCFDERLAAEVGSRARCRRASH